MLHGPTLLTQTALNSPLFIEIKPQRFLVFSPAHHHPSSLEKLAVTIMKGLCSPKYKFPIWLVFKYVVQSLGEIAIDVCVTWYDNITGVDWQHKCTIKLKAFCISPVFVLAADSCRQSNNRSVCRTGGWNRLSSGTPRVPGQRLARFWALLPEESQEPGNRQFII
jgi:hypothetical protein